MVRLEAAPLHRRGGNFEFLLPVFSPSDAFILLLSLFEVTT
jgi:hypothetical protein